MAVTSIGSSASTATTSSGTDINKLSGNFDTFLKLLTTQLKTQSPMNPMDTNQFTQQLVQYSQVEQQIKSNDYLSYLVSAIAQNNINTANSSALNLVGKTVTGAGDAADLTGGKASWNYTLDANAKVQMIVSDADGKVVSSSLQNVDAGAGTFSWDGTLPDGTKATSGTYTLKLTATDGTGKSVPISTANTGVVTGVDFTGDEPILMLGSQKFKLSTVTRVEAS